MTDDERFEQWVAENPELIWRMPRVEAVRNGFRAGLENQPHRCSNGDCTAENCETRRRWVERLSESGDG